MVKVKHHYDVPVPNIAWARAKTVPLLKRLYLHATDTQKVKINLPSDLLTEIPDVGS